MLVTKNAYNILGLSSDNDEKQINKRYKEILNLLSIDEVPLYDSDAPFVDYEELRKESNIKEALHKLNSQKKSLYEFFFWFNIVDKEDEKCLKLYAKGEYADAIDKRSNLYDEKKKAHYLKNALIANIFLYENLKQFSDLDFSEDPKFIVKGLYRLLNSNSFWKEFEVMYNMNNTIPLSKNLLNDFKNDLPQFLTESFFDIGEEVGTNRLYRIFSKKFGLVAQELDDNKNVTGPVKKIEQYLKDIDDADRKKDIDYIIGRAEKIQKYVEKLEKLGLSENAKIIKLKDESAKSILSAAIDINNNHEDYESGLKLLDFAEAVAHSETIKIRIGNNREVFEENLEYKKTGKATFTDENGEKQKIKYGRKPGILGSINGIGTKIYGDTLYFVFFFIPIFPISRRSCDDVGDNTYRFYGKLELKTWQKVWKWIALLGLAIWIIIGMVNS